MDEIVGTWELVSFAISFSDDRAEIHPFGETPFGRLIYSNDGFMSAVLADPKRELVESRAIESSSKLSADEKGNAFETYLSYTGRFTTDGATVVHEVDAAMVPGTAGTTLKRTAAFDGSHLTLSYQRTAKSGVIRNYSLVWKRP